MSHDWARNYIEVHKQRQQEKQDAQERLRLARAGAPGMFQRIKNRVRHDLRTFHDVSVLQALELNDISSESFSVNDVSYLGNRPTLLVELESVLVKYWHKFPPKGNEREPYRNAGTLRICSDVNGVTQVYRNGSGEAFADESDISEFLLKPLLDYVDG